MTELSEILKGFEPRTPATASAIVECERKLLLRLPSDYVRFLETSDGGEGFIGKHGDDTWYLVLWKVEKLAPFHEELEVAREIPGFLAIGGDGGGELFGFDTRKTPWPVVMVPRLPMEWEEALPVGDSFTDFLQKLYDGFDPFQ